MPRPRIIRRIRFNPDVRYFKPRGIPLKSLEEVVLKADELEAIKLHDLDGLDQTQAALKMGISQPTFARTLNKAHQTIAEALISGKAIRIEGN
jgi:predicted DNA-binding protein (UPF0251 family)